MYSYSFHFAFQVAMRFKRIKSDDIRRLLEDEEDSFPSDYNDDTDEEWEGVACEARNPLDATEDILVVVEDDALPEEAVHTISENTARQEKKDVPKQQQGRKWRVRPEPATNTEFQPSTFFVSPDVSTPLETFLSFFNEDILNRIHFETNLKSVQKNKPAAVTEDELKVFLGINIVMGYHRLPTIKSYWNTAEDLNVPVVSKAMRRERFQTILSNLHVNDNTKMDPKKKDKLFKIRPLLEHLNDVFGKLRSMREHLSIDESMIRFKGRSSLKQYNPMKPIKRGYKLWCLADDSGYIYKTNVYTGKGESQENTESSKEFGLGGKVVLSLLIDIKSKNHKVFMDNYFSSIPLMEELKNKEVLACGTIRSNRKDFPKLKEDKCLTRGQYDYRSTPSGITVFKWKDSKAVHFISNYHGIEETSVQRKQKDGSKVTVPCPQVVKDYNSFMGGVDKHDMLRQLYGTDRKNVKWWHRLFFGLMDITIVNAFIVYKEQNVESSLTIFDFYREVGCGLLTFSQRSTPGAVKRRKMNYSKPESVRLGNTGIHWPEFSTSKNRCEVCSRNGITARPLSKCSHCGVHLCCNTTKNCFREYHMK